MLTDDEAELLAQKVESNPNYRVLRRISSRLIPGGEVSGSFPTKRAAVIAALEELAKRYRRRELAATRGKVMWQGDLEKWRTSRAPVKPR